MTEEIEASRDCLDLHLDPRSKRTLERAAAYRGTSVSQFVLASAVAAAERVIAAQERIVLAEADWGAFHDALHTPPEPNAALRKAA